MYTISVAPTVAEGILSVGRSGSLRGREGLGKSVKGAGKDRERRPGC